ncbi:protein-methionine-sulfoxide reductase heme-binding subunit MsrQ [Meridianimarinicoccus aquatilis]|uniref:Protein-methionine-sulfoxide reductase heme-binding subunit MsrQ n=1 Tax=Meridianimarinicoccus aquatilis TaxID=2552766 RepID=A0A4R6AKL0_9RHOB|nr:protein-methionine-sulfoxide reductase heme-binding subunit MsrQ [Fluviibacterium aquatile]TDL84811.1 protein-methionine-sulfoxide reductase heme-binding subunit MsrQ [Fluviibacterium aquatile]
MGLADPINKTVRRVPVWSVYLMGAVPMGWLFYQGATGGLGPEPIKALEHRYGLIALQLLVAGLCITPLIRFVRINLMRFRRAIGVLAFSYVAAHLLVWLVLDLRSIALIWSDIVKRPYITIGMVGFLCLQPLAMTSNNWSVRRLGPLWRKLHKLTYLAVLLGAVHFVMLVKGWQWEPLLYLGAIVCLLALRIPAIQGPLLQVRGGAMKSAHPRGG